MTYSTAFKNIDTRTVEATKKLVKSGIWKNIEPVLKISAINEWLKTVSEVYGVNEPAFIFDHSEGRYLETGGGTYSPSDELITLYYKFSLVTLLHEFRHHIQHQKRTKLYGGDIEEDARAWSVSLFKSATPKAYENSVRKGLLHFN